MLLAIGHEELCIQRAADPPGGIRSGGLVIAQRKLAAQVDFITKTLRASAVLVHSDFDEAHEDIHRFRENDTEWLVAVDMVTEGVDIPRLRTLVYASNERTLLRFLQSFGRLLPLVKEWLLVIKR